MVKATNLTNSNDNKVERQGKEEEEIGIKAVLETSNKRIKGEEKRVETQGGAKDFYDHDV